MAAQPVEWVLVIFYGRSAHRATYGRLKGTLYTKDYIQLSKKAEFMETVSSLFPVTANGDVSVPLTYRWPTGMAPGSFVYNSSDRPHLKWVTGLGAPQAWKMSITPSEDTAETIPGDPTHLDFNDAEMELELLATRGAGQPYLLAVKLRNEIRTLHLRAYLKDPSEDYSWADLELVPEEVRALSEKTHQESALAWSTFQSGGIAPSTKVEEALSLLTRSENLVSVIESLDADTGRALATYLHHPGYGLFFDPSKNHEAWSQPAHLSMQVTSSVDAILQALEVEYSEHFLGDAEAETFEADPEKVKAFHEQIAQRNYEVGDSTGTTKVRGSAQRAFAEAVKTNYGYRCAITGVVTKEFLVASHIVPWSEDQSIRLDPSNGICLSLLVDRAFEKGFLLIEDDLTIRIDWGKVGEDHVLQSQLEPYEGQKVRAPERGGPQPEYLRRRRALVASPD